MNEEIRKKVDDGWKSQVEKEKETAGGNKEEYHQPTFAIFLSSISMQAMIAMGRIENPVTNKKENNLEQARFLIDTLGILKDKTKGNLASEEESLLNDSLFNLRMMYVEERNKNDK